jgi:hypothetical protein
LSDRGELVFSDGQLTFQQVFKEREAGLLLACLFPELDGRENFLQTFLQAVLLQKAYERLGRGFVRVRGLRQAGCGRLHDLEGMPRKALRQVGRSKSQATNKQEMRKPTEVTSLGASANHPPAQQDGQQTARRRHSADGAEFADSPTPDRSDAPLREPSTMAVLVPSQQLDSARQNRMHGAALISQQQATLFIQARADAALAIDSHALSQ